MTSSGFGEREENTVLRGEVIGVKVAELDGMSFSLDFSSTWWVKSFSLFGARKSRKVPDNSIEDGVDEGVARHTEPAVSIIKRMAFSSRMFRLNWHKSDK